MERRARSGRRSRDRRERGGGVRSRAPLAPGRARPSVRRVAAQGSLRRRRGSGLGARRAAPPRPRGRDDRPRRRRAPHARVVRAAADRSPPTSLFFGEAGLLTVAYRLAPSDELADRLFARVTENTHNDANELMWGAPGTMLIAHAMHEWTGDQRWSDAWAESADEVRRRRDEHGLWTQHLGKAPPQRMLGAAHGAVSNQLALLQALAGRGRARRRADARANRDRRRAARQLADGQRAAPRTQGPDPGAVVPRRTGDRQLRGLVPPGGAPARRRGAHLASGPPQAGTRASATARRATATRC